MDEQKIGALASDVADFVFSKIDETTWTPLEVSHVLGEALAILVVEPFINSTGKGFKSAVQPDDEEEEEEEEELKAIYSEEEMEYMRLRLLSKYPLEVVALIAKGDVPVPRWLRREIVERRRNEA